MDNTKLIARAISWLRADDKFPRVDANDIVQDLAVALEAAEAELTRRDTVIEHEELSALCRSFLKPPTFSGGSWTLNPDALATAILERLAAVPVSLEAVKAEAPWDRTDGCFGHCDPEGWYATCLAPCDVPPPGWWCSRGRGHDGPCAAWPVSTEGDAK